MKKSDLNYSFEDMHYVSSDVTNQKMTFGLSPTCEEELKILKKVVGAKANMGSKKNKSE